MSARLDCATLRMVSKLERGDVHATQPSCVSITQTTELGSVYSLDEIGAIGEVCKSASLRLHMDGSRFANALVTLNTTPAEMTWKAGGRYAFLRGHDATLSDGLAQEGFGFYRDRRAPGVARFVTSFVISTRDVDQLIQSMKRLSGSASG